jgi:hypothetical protein
MYTENMRRVVHNIKPPKGFGISIIDNEHFLTIKLNEKDFYYLTHQEKLEVVQYIVTVKNALEQNGAVVLVTREVLK